MAIIGKDRVIQDVEINAALKTIAENVSKISTAFDLVATNAAKLTKELGGADNLSKLIKTTKDISKNTEELTFNQYELAKQHQELGKVTAQLDEIQSHYNKEIQKTKIQIKEANDAIKEEITGSKKLADEKRKLTEESKKKAIADKQSAQAVKINAQEEKLKLAVESQAVGSIRRLQAENTLYAFTIKNKLNPAIASERAEILRLNQIIGTNKDAISDMQRKNVTAWQRVTQAVWQHLAAYVGFTQLIQIIKNVFALTRELDSLHFSMQTIIKSQVELAQTQQFLADIAQKYGLDLLAISERYIKFRAAALQSNITAKETMQIFNSMAKAAAVLGLKTDEVAGVFLALEQMISKGKVTTEELRRQLGERLPGAFGIMADALGVSLQQLDKMLKAGTILSADALPKFAIAVEKAYGIESVNKVNTLAAAQGRLKTSWVQFVDEINQSQNFIKILNKVSTALNDIRYAFGLTDELEKYSQGIDKTSIAVQEVIKKFDDFGDVGQNRFKDVSKYQKEWIATLKESGVREGLAGKLFDQYVAKRRRMFEEETKTSTKTTPFTSSDYKKTLDDANNEFETFASLQDKELKQSFLGISAFIKNESDTEKSYLLDQSKLMKKNSEDAWKFYSDLEKKKQDISEFNKGRDVKDQKLFTKEEQTELAVRYNNYQEYVDSRAEIDKRLKKLNEGDKKTNKSKFDSTKEENEQILADLKRRQQIELETEAETQDKIYANRDKNAVEQVLFDGVLALKEQDQKQQYIDKQIELNKKLQKSSFLTPEQRAQAITDGKKLEEEKQQAITDTKVDGMKRANNLEKAMNKQWKQEDIVASNKELSDAESDIHNLALLKIAAAGKEINAAKGKAVKIKYIEDQLTLDLIKNEHDRLKASLDSGKVIGTDREQLIKRINELEEQYNLKSNDITKENDKIKLEGKQQMFDQSAELLNAGFNFAKQIYSNEQELVKQTYDNEIKAAGDNLEAQTLAKRKYETESKKIRQRIAIADKAQAAFNIILSTTLGIMKVWEQFAAFPPIAIALSALMGTIGAVNLASVLSAPIPALFKGMENTPDTFIAGDTPDGKGATELVELQSGESFLTPAKATLFSDKKFKGATVYPHFHDKTQQMLNSYALNGGSQMFVDMSRSEKSLDIIAKNTKSNEQRFVNAKGQTVVKRGNNQTILC
jgi:tape measure domain-containing protein